MNALYPMRKPVSRAEDVAIKRRLLAALPASRFEMDTLTRLVSIQTSRALPTAAVECKRRPRLLINPDFVEKFCQNDNHLFLLVMHELWHVMLAHTRMYPRMTQAQNIAFDAIINAGLMHEFHRPEYRGFFDAVNPHDQFPHLLLRPPVGWPEKPIYPEGVGPEGTRDLLMRLYPQGAFANFNPPMYEEVLALVLKGGGDMQGLMLLGSHDSVPEHDPLMKEIMKQASARWPKLMIGGGGEGDYLRNQTFGVVDPESEPARRVFSRVLQICVGRSHGPLHRKSRQRTTVIGGAGVLPNARDRLAPARRSLGAPSVLWSQPVEMRAVLPQEPARAYIYLDVSGSMNFILTYLLGLLLPYVGRGEAEVFQFSTTIVPLSLGDLRRGLLNTTGGTDINCILEHLLAAQPPIRRAVLLTDGEVGAPLPHLVRAIQERGVALHFVLPWDCRLDDGVAAVARSAVALPPIT